MIDAGDFLGVIQSEVEKGNKPVFLIGTIPATYVSGSGQPTLQFDGESVASTRTFPFVTSYNPKANDRVIVSLINNGAVILGKHGAAYDGPPLTPQYTPTVYSGTVDIQYTNGGWNNIINSQQVGANGSADVNGRSYLFTIEFHSADKGGTIWFCTVSGIWACRDATNMADAIAIPISYGGHAMNSKTLACRMLGSLQADGKSYLQLQINGEAPTSPVRFTWRAQKLFV